MKTTTLKCTFLHKTHRKRIRGLQASKVRVFELNFFRTLPCLTRLTDFYEFDTTVKDIREKVCACFGTVSFYCNPPIVL